MKLYKIILALLAIISLVFSIQLIANFSHSPVVGIAQILLLCFLTAIPMLLVLWVILKKKDNMFIKQKNIIWALIIFVAGTIWLVSVKQSQNRSIPKMMQIENSAKH